MKSKVLAGLLALLTMAPVAAMQPIDVRDGVTVEAVVAQEEPTRIRVEGARITGVTGNIYSSSCPAKGADGALAPAQPQPGAVNPQGEFVLSCDSAKGEVYVRPVAGKSRKPINIFVSTERATYTLLLRRADMPAGTIVLKDKTARAPGATASAGPAARSAPHIRALKALLQAMTDRAERDDVTVEQVNAPRTLWAEARFELVRVVHKDALAGEEYLLTNISEEPMVLAEQEFDRDGVLAVAIENMNLRPGESTAVYVLRTGE